MRRTKIVLKWVLGAGMIAGGLNHFHSTATYMRSMPPYLPWHKELVYISGVVEAGLGLLLLFRRTQRPAAWGLIATFVAVFPANLYMAMTSGTASPAIPEVSPLLSWLRLPLQLLLIAWADWYTRPDER
ncbi:MAG: DoxX family membrane protein [Armatimonadota bacterium]|nr:DoxX family membrane protein [Armatimonadota bacterium]